MVCQPHGRHIEREIMTCNISEGDKAEIEFEVYVNKTTAPSLNRGEENIDDILILHLVGGGLWFCKSNFPLCSKK